MELFAADGHDAGGCERVTGKSGMRPKKVTNHAYQVALNVVFHNFVRIHQTLGMRPAMAAGVTDELQDMDWLVGLVEARDSQPCPRGPYRRERKKRKDAGVPRK